MEIVDDLILDVADIFSPQNINIGTPQIALIPWNLFHPKWDMLYTHTLFHIHRNFFIVFAIPRDQSVFLFGNLHEFFETRPKEPELDVEWYHESLHVLLQ